MSPPVIELARSEILNNSTIPWNQLDAQQRRFLAAKILSKRGDENSLRFVRNLEFAVPQFNTFTILEDVGTPVFG